MSPSEKSMSSYAKGSAKVTLSFFSIILGLVDLFIIELFGNRSLGLIVLALGIVLFFVGTIQKRQMKKELLHQSFENAKKSEE